MTNDNPTHALEDVDTIVVDPDDIIKTMQRNRRNEAEQVTHVLRVSPPLDSECRASTHCSQDGAYYPPEMDPKPHHFMPKDFITGHTNDTLQEYFYPPERSTTRSQFRQQPHIDVPDDTSKWTEEDEALFESYFEETEQIWLDHVHSNLADSITDAQMISTVDNGQLGAAKVTATVPVEYVSSDNEADQ
jgi:hypothetical protein